MTMVSILRVPIRKGQQSSVSIAKPSVEANVYPIVSPPYNFVIEKAGIIVVGAVPVGAELANIGLLDSRLKFFTDVITIDSSALYPFYKEFTLTQNTFSVGEIITASVAYDDGGEPAPSLSGILIQINYKEA